MKTEDMIAFLTGWRLINTQMWYMVEIIFLYVAFFFIFKYVKNTTAGIWLMGLFIAVMVSVSILLGHGPMGNSDKWFHGEWWFNTPHMFLIGMIFSEKEEKIVAFVKKYYVILLLLCMAAAIGLRFPMWERMSRSTYYCEYFGRLPLFQIYTIKLETLFWQAGVIFFTLMIPLLLMMKIKTLSGIHPNIIG